MQPRTLRVSTDLSPQPISLTLMGHLSIRVCLLLVYPLSHHPPVNYPPGTRLPAALGIFPPISLTLMGTPNSYLSIIRHHPVPYFPGIRLPAGLAWA